MKKVILAYVVVVAACVFSSVPTTYAQSDPYIGQIMWTAANFCPRNWAEANGQLIAVNQNEALFALLGTTYGGDGRTSFALPDLRGRVSLHNGTGQGLSNRSLGSKGGAEQVVLTPQQLPRHSHALRARTGTATTTGPGRQLSSQANIYSNEGNTTRLSRRSIGQTGASQPHDNMPPFLTLKACVALVGVFPPRN